MRYERVFVESLGYELGPQVISSSALEARLASLYQSLHIQPGQVVALTGVRERRWWNPGFRLADGAIRAGKAALDRTSVRGPDLGIVIYAGVCRDGYEPATACAVAHGLGVGPETQIYDLSNACLGVMNGCLVVADLIESGRIRAGIVTSCESAREINEAMIERMLAEPTMERFRLSLATLTGGSGAAAVVLTDGSFPEVSPRHRLLGGVVRTAPEHNRLCRWRLEPTGRALMETDATGVLKNGIALGTRTWQALLDELRWRSEDVSKVVCHQVGGGHRDAMLSALGVALERDFPTFEYLGNMGTVSLPITAALAAERGFLDPGDRVALLGIGSGLNCLMLGLAW